MTDNSSNHCFGLRRPAKLKHASQREEAAMRKIQQTFVFRDNSFRVLYESEIRDIAPLRYTGINDGSGKSCDTWFSNSEAFRLGLWSQTGSDLYPFAVLVEISSSWTSILCQTLPEALQLVERWLPLASAAYAGENLSIGSFPYPRRKLTLNEVKQTRAEIAEFKRKSKDAAYVKRVWDEAVEQVGELPEVQALIRELESQASRAPIAVDPEREAVHREVVRMFHDLQNFDSDEETRS